MVNDELIDIIDENDKVIGVAPKSEIHKNGLRHRVAAVLLQNERGEYLIPTASEKKVEAGGLFHSSAGHVRSGHSYAESAKRELQEETQIRTESTPVLLGYFWLEKDYPTRKERERFAVFKIKYAPAMGRIIFNDEQVNEQWMNEKTLRQMYFDTPEKLSYPLLLSCKYIFNFG